MKGLKRLNLLAGLILVVLLLSAGVYLQGLVKQQTVQADKSIVLASDSNCDLNQQGCVARLGNKSVIVSFKQPVRYLTRFEIQAVISGFDSTLIEKILVDFTMPGMQMGINRFALTRLNDQGYWQGMAILPVCISGRKDWQVTLFIKTREASYTVVYKVIVEN